MCQDIGIASPLAVWTRCTPMLHGNQEAKTSPYNFKQFS